MQAGSVREWRAVCGESRKHGSEGGVGISSLRCSAPTLSYHGAERVVEHYNLMGPVKAALESTVRYLAAELGPQGIRVHAISPGPIRTRAASGIDRFDELMEQAAARAPSRQLVGIEDVGAVTAFLASDAAKAITGGTIYVDSGYNIMA